MKSDIRFDEYWLNKPKEEIIEAYKGCIHNGEVLLNRINRAIEEIEIWQPKNQALRIELNYIIEILEGNDL